MHKGKGGQYVSAGVQGTPGVKFDVRSNVRLPDSEAGAAWREEGRPQPYYAENVCPLPRQPRTVPLNTAMIALCVLFVFFGTVVLVKSSRRAELSKQISDIEVSILDRAAKNAELEIGLAEARDSVRIGYDAAQKLHMVATASEAPVTVTAPSTRPFGEEGTLQEGTVFGSVQSAQIIGSR